MDSETLTTAVAFLSLGLSGFTLWLQRRDAGRANFTVDWVTPTSIEVVNRGPGAARRVRGSIALIPSGPERESLKVAYMAPGQVARIADRPMVSEERPSDLSLCWRDNRIRRRRQSLTVPDAPTAPVRPPRASRDGLEKLVRDVAREEISDDARFRG